MAPCGVTNPAARLLPMAMPRTPLSSSAMEPASAVTSPSFTTSNGTPPQAACRSKNRRRRGGFLFGGGGIECHVVDHHGAAINAVAHEFVVEGARAGGGIHRAQVVCDARLAANGDAVSALLP